MRIALLQTDIIWRNEAENIVRAATMADSVEADLYLLPEMWNTGFDVNPERLTRDEDACEALQWMKQFSLRRKCAVAGSIIVRDGAKLFNRFFFVDCGAIIARYDKHHLFSPGGETRQISAGQDRVTVEWRSVRFRLATCYDLRFPVWTRNFRVDRRPDYDVLMFVASWPDVRGMVWKTLLRSRAIENQCICIGCNRVGSDPYCSYEGESLVVDAYGNIVENCGIQPVAKVVELPIEHLHSFREKFDTLSDADEFEILH